MDLENFVGHLAETYKRVDSSSVRNAAQLSAERLGNESLRNEWFWVSDACTATIDGDDVVYHLTQAPEDNPIFANVDEATRQLIRDNNYVVSGDDLEAVVNAGSVLSVKASDLQLTKGNDEYSYFEVETGNLEGAYGLNDAQRLVAERAYGESDKVFDATMKMLSDAGISKTKVYVPNPDYVKSNLEDTEGSGLVRACRLDDFISNSSFIAFGRIVNNDSVVLRGVPKIAEGDAQKIEASNGLEPADVIDYLRDNPIKNDALAKACLGAANKFYQNQ